MDAGDYLQTIMSLHKQDYSYETDVLQANLYLHNEMQSERARGLKMVNKLIDQ